MLTETKEQRRERIEAAIWGRLKISTCLDICHFQRGCGCVVALANAIIASDEAAGLVVVPSDRISGAIELAIRYGGTDGGHHKMWVIDQMVRTLAGDDYDRIIQESRAGEDGPETYGWDVGIAP